MWQLERIQDAEESVFTDTVSHRFKGDGITDSIIGSVIDAEDL